MLKSGNLRADKINFPDGDSCSVWYPFPDDEESGLCFDFSFSDIDDFSMLLKRLRTEPAMEPDPEPELAPPTFGEKVRSLFMYPLHSFAWWILEQ